MKYQPIVTSLDSFVKTALNILPSVLEISLKTSKGHKADLPNAIKELSNSLTSERHNLTRPYWLSPRFTAAYMWYFLPWNLIRYTKIMKAWSFSCVEELPYVLDLGSGPLTMPLALWLSQPALRKLPLQVVCIDTSQHIMKLGFEVFKCLAERLGEVVSWKFVFIRDSLPRAVYSLRFSAGLVMAGNVFNEVKMHRNEGFEEGIEKFFRPLAQVIGERGEVLVVEPGTRFGGKITTTFRDVAMQKGFTSLSPCTHMGLCPFRKTISKSWCHVSFPAESPDWLTKLTDKAYLHKASLSIAFQMMKKGYIPEENDCAQEEFLGRIVSEAFYVEGNGYARYACTIKGLAILAHAQKAYFGSVVLCKVQKEKQRDVKSGAIWCAWVLKE